MKALWVLAVLSLSLTTRAAEITFDGTITTVVQNGFPDFGLSVGTPFSLAVTYDAAAVPDAINGATIPGENTSRYLVPSQFTLTVGSLEFHQRGISPMILWAADSATLGDQFSVHYLAELTDPWAGSQSHRGALSADLYDPTGSALDSSAIPAILTMADWGSGVLHFGGGDGNSLSYDLSGNITAVRIPDSGSTISLLLIALCSLLATRRGFNASI